MTRSTAWAALLLFAVVAVSGCGLASGGDYVDPGTYAGVSSDGTEFVVVINNNKITVNGVDAEYDDTKHNTVFVVTKVQGRPEWSCNPIENGDAMRCAVKAPGFNETFDLMKENKPS